MYLTTLGVTYCMMPGAPGTQAGCGWDADVLLPFASTTAPFTAFPTIRESRMCASPPSTYTTAYGGIAAPQLSTLSADMFKNVQRCTNAVAFRCTSSAARPPYFSGPAVVCHPVLCCVPPCIAKSFSTRVLFGQATTPASSTGNGAQLATRPKMSVRTPCNMQSVSPKEDLDCEWHGARPPRSFSVALKVLTIWHSAVGSP